MSIQKVQNAFEFFKSTLAINLAVSVLSLLFLGIVAFNCVFLSFGFVVSLAVKEVRSKNEYLFYFNNQISKVELWFYSWCFNFGFLAIGVFLYNLIMKLF